MQILLLKIRQFKIYLIAHIYVMTYITITLRNIILLNSLVTLNFSHLIPTDTSKAKYMW